MKRKCVFAGTFDPLTKGHEALVGQCLQLFDEVVVAILCNPAKAPLFTVEQRKQMMQLAFGNEPRIRVVEFSGTVAELLEKEDTPFYVRGIRNTVDFEYENANYFASKRLNAGIIPIYLPCPQELLHVSSSMVRSSLQFKTPISDYVSEGVEEYIYSSNCFET
jgi:pantetheine-phosphate adenylyltransferase